MKGADFVDGNSARQLMNQVKEGDFARELPTMLELTHFYLSNKLPPLTDFPDMPDYCRDAFMILNIARTQPMLFAKSYLEKFKHRYTSSEGVGGLPNVYVTIDK